MMKTSKLKYLLSAVVLCATMGANAAPTTHAKNTTSRNYAPPNTMDLSGLQQKSMPYIQQTQSPVIASTPPNIQPYIAPSPQTTMGQELNDYMGLQLTPAQMQQLKDWQLSNQRITATPYNTLPNPVVRSLAVDLSPGKTPPIIRVAKNMLTSIVFTDIDGNPWYIEKVALNRGQFTDSSSKTTESGNEGINPQDFQPIGANANNQGNITADGTQSNDSGNAANANRSATSTYRAGVNSSRTNSTYTSNENDPTANLTNILTLEPRQAVDFGNVSITLRGKTTPVIFMIASGQSEVDIRVDAKISGKNPDIKYGINSPLNSITQNTHVDTPDLDSVALAFLDGTVPQDANPLVASDTSVQAWEYNDKLYVKTRFDVLYPNFMSRASSADGVKIYRFDSGVNDITFLQRQGQPVTVSFEQQPSTPYYER